jgi:hypothetical protein
MEFYFIKKIYNENDIFDNVYIVRLFCGIIEYNETGFDY